MPGVVQPGDAAAIVGSALEIIGQRHDARSRALATVSALRLIRSTIQEHAGLGATRQFDEWLADRVDDHRRQLDRKLPVMKLPDAKAAAYRADLIARDAVLSCFFLNGQTPDNTLILTAAGTLVDALAAALGGPPAWDLLLARLQEEEPEGSLDLAASSGMIMLQ